MATAISTTIVSLNQICMNYTQKIKTRRFVYHLTYKVHRESILKKGLLANCYENQYKNAIFAHNTSKPSHLWYPYVLDVYDIPYHLLNIVVNNDYCIETDFLLLNYDIWRIDTKALKRQWYFDNIAISQFLEGENYPYYVMTFGNIPPTALKLVNLSKPFEIEFKKKEVAHIYTHFK
jgi:hypothetical protein